MSKVVIMYYNKLSRERQREMIDINNNETVKDVILRSNTYRSMIYRFYVVVPCFHKMTLDELEQKANQIGGRWTLVAVSDEDERTNLINPREEIKKRTREETEQKFKQQIVHGLKDTERVFKKYCQEVDRFIDQAKQTEVRQDNLIKELNDEITGLEQVVRDLKRKK